jgi:hypothetical protein
MTTPRVRKKIVSPAAPRASAREQGGSLSTEEAVKRRAYELFLERGGIHGEDWNDWFSAERQLLGAKSRSAARRTATTAHDS